MQQESAPRRTRRTAIEREITSMYFGMKSNSWQRRNWEKTNLKNLLTSNSQRRSARTATPMRIDDGTRDTQLKSRAYSNFRERRMREKNERGAEIEMQAMEELGRKRRKRLLGLKCWRDSKIRAKFQLGFFCLLFFFHNQQRLFL